MVLGELLAGFEAGARAEANRRLLSRFLAASRVKLLSLGPETAEHYADIYAGLRRKGRPIPANDMWIAASAREHGLMVLTRDSHFRQVDGLLVGLVSRAAVALTDFGAATLLYCSGIDYSDSVVPPLFSRSLA